MTTTSPPAGALVQGPLRSRRRAQLAARLLTAVELERPAAALPRLRRRLAALASARRFEDAARLRDRIAALECVCRELERTARLRTLERCLLVPALEPGHVRAYFVAGGRIAAERTLPPGGGAALEVEAGLAASRRSARSGGEADGSLEELALVGAFLRRPPPELRAAPLEREAILRAAAALARAGATAAAAGAVAAPRRRLQPQPPPGPSLFER